MNGSLRRFWYLGEMTNSCISFDTAFAAPVCFDLQPLICAFESGGWGHVCVTVPPDGVLRGRLFL